MRLLAALLLLTPAWAPADEAADARLPADVRSFLERREACDHWGGEEPYDKARAAEIARGVARDCRGTDRQLALLKQRYAQRFDVAARLSAFEATVEGPAQKPPPSSCRADEKAVTGAWMLLRGDAYLEQFALEVDAGRQVFNSWLHERPETSGGHWELADCVLSISSPSEPSLALTFVIRLIGRDRLELKPAEGGKVAVYRRIRQR
ncbi:MAG: hypothetical protein M3Z16_00600 [Pseudomonadota bacterium]|nr:hypothetical protein [Pseudomonadota bacterium]